MAPDKIYLKPLLMEDGESIMRKCSEEPKKGYTIEYIHKDALLEWIQEARAIPHENAIIRDLALQEVVNKLNSM